MTRDLNIERWLCDQVAPAYDAMKSEQSHGITSNQVRARLSSEHARMARISARIRPGGVIVIPRPILMALGWAPGEAMEVTIEMRGNRLFVAKKPAASEAKLARFKARLAERLRRLRIGGEDADWNAAWGEEAARRMAAFDRGEVAALDADAVFDELDTKHQ